MVAIGGWRVAVGGWQLAAVGGGWWLVIGGWWRLAVVGIWWLAAVGGWQLVAVGGWWRLVVGGWWSAVLSKKKLEVLRDGPAAGAVPAPHCTGWRHTCPRSATRHPPYRRLCPSTTRAQNTGRPGFRQHITNRNPPAKPLNKLQATGHNTAQTSALWHVARAWAWHADATKEMPRDAPDPRRPRHARHDSAGCVVSSSGHSPTPCVTKRVARAEIHRISQRLRFHLLRYRPLHPPPFVSCLGASMSHGVRAGGADTGKRDVVIGHTNTECPPPAAWSSGSTLGCTSRITPYPMAGMY